MNTLIIILAIIVSQALAAALFNALQDIRTPKSFWDLIKLLFLPYTIYLRIVGRHE